MARPIYEDVFCTEIPNNGDFTISVDGEIIYSGRAVARPNGGTSINISRICQDYLDCKGEFITIGGVGTMEHRNAYRTFIVQWDGGSESYDFLYCWDYKTKYIDTNMELSTPIDGKAMTGMYRFNTIKSGSTVTSWVSQMEHPSTNKYNDGYCGEGALYYINAKGGWDAFLLRGKIRRTDNYERYKIMSSIDNKTLDFETYTYNNTITPTWEIGTGWLNDVQSKNLASNLLSSTVVYFHNLEEDRIYPVYITNDNGTYKTYKNNKGMVSYTLTITASQGRRRL